MLKKKKKKSPTSAIKKFLWTKFGEYLPQKQSCPCSSDLPILVCKVPGQLETGIFPVLFAVV